MKLFIIAPHFPPSSLPPAQRVRLIVKHALALGCYPIVFTTPSKYREEPDDEWMVELAGNDFKKIEVRAISHRITRKIGFGDLGLRLIPFMFPVILKHAHKEKPDFILYPVPPWYMLIIAPIIKFFNKIPYGIDFIDPWVDVAAGSTAGMKRKISQKIARVFERRAVRNASLIYSVSEGINKGIVERYPETGNIPFYAIPYGVEPADFKINVQNLPAPPEYKLLRYVGAVWTDSYPVLEVLLKAFGKIKNKHQFKLEFYGTSYAPAGLAAPQLNEWKEKYQLAHVLTEKPNRVSYKDAVRLTMEADFLFLFGGMQPYYAASKLMGLLVSKKIFAAFVHRDSFPAKVLQELKYPYLVLYSHTSSDLPADHLQEVEIMLENMFSGKFKFEGADFVKNEFLMQHTAYGMTKQFLDPINELLNKK
ncbi:MAG: hypothetical protein IT235_03705 [Bacteroidia bacterium]|nr:hypothetical protein [Bacteroidia bacterium]